MLNPIQTTAEAWLTDCPLTTSLHPDEMPERYAMMVCGDCMEPLYANGTKLLFSRVEPYKFGDCVVIFKRPDFTAPGDHQVIIKRLVFGPRQQFWTDPNFNTGSNIQPILIVEMLNPATKLYLNPAHIFGVHKCIGPVLGHTKTFKVTDEWVRQQAIANTSKEKFQ